MKLIKIKNESDIYLSMTLLSSDIYNQSLNNENIIKTLSKKYSQYSNFYICKTQDKIIGYCSFYTNLIKNSSCFLSMIVVKKEYRNNGVGTLFMNKIEEICKTKNINAIELSVNKNNERAIDFYYKKGFRIIKNEESYYMMRKVYKK